MAEKISQEALADKNASASETGTDDRLADVREATFGPTTRAAKEVPATYCNPMNLDYAYVPEKPYSLNNNHRSTADASAINYNGDILLFSTNQEGYWSSRDLGSWRFIPHKFKPNGNNDQVCAPAAWPTSHGVLVLPSFNDDVTMPLYRSKDPGKGIWSEAVKSFPTPGWDPQLFEDDDKRLYLYWGSSNFYPLRGVEIDPQNGFAQKGTPVDMLRLKPKEHGWEQFGQDNQNGGMDPFIEGAWMNKFNGRYYMQYAAPGTEWNVYGDGVYTSNSPLGPFAYQAHNPFCWKPTGYVQGAGHGSTFSDNHGNLWHVGSMIIGRKDKFERRLSMFPTAVDKDGVLHSDTSFGDYPHRLPTQQRDASNDFTGWMLLSYNKKAWASQSTFEPSQAFDENAKTFWSAGDAKAGQFLAVDLGTPSEVHAIQVNFADDDAHAYGKQVGFHHRYEIYESGDGKNWNLLVDKSKNDRDVPHDYIELAEPVRTQFLKVVNVEMPTGNFAIGDLRVFGKAPGAVPENVDDFAVGRDEADRRNATLKWKAVPGAYAYNVAFGVEPDKLYSSLLVHGSNEYNMHSLNTGSPYYFKIQAVSETGVSKWSAIESTK